MNSLDGLRNLARALGRRGFAARFSNGFLLRHPVTREEADDDAGFDDDAEDLRFSTGVIDQEALGMDLIDELGPDASAELIIVPVMKKARNPFPERLGIGRARNVDIVLRLPSVSKLHAHFHLEQSRVARLSDYQSSNGTFVNGVSVGRDGRAVRIGDVLRFGAVEVMLVSAETALDALVQPAAGRETG